MRVFNSDDVLRRSTDLIATELDDETVLMSITAGVYYGLEGPARTIWEKLDSPMTFGQLVDTLTREYRVSRETCSSDLQGFLAQMESEELVHVD